MVEERKFDFMPRWPKPHIKRNVVIFTNPLYPHTRYMTGPHAKTVAEAWAHLPAMRKWHGVTS